MPLYEFSPISGDCGMLGMPYLAGICLIIRYFMLQNAKYTALTISELLKENQKEVKILSHHQE